MSDIHARLGGARSGLAFKAPCVVATTTNIALSGTQTIDGVAVTADQRVLVKDQTDGSQNGVWLCKATTWERARDFSGTGDVVTGTRVYVWGGSTQYGEYVVATTGDIIIGVTSLVISGIQIPSALLEIGHISDTTLTRSSAGRIAIEGVNLALDTFLQAGTGAVTRTVQDKQREIFSVLDFIPTALHAAIIAGTSSDDVATYLSAARDAIAALTVPATLQFPGGVYSYSSSPNWGINNVRIEALGEVRLRYTGTSNAVIIDGGALGYVNNMHMGRFIVECTSASADNAVYVRSVHHSNLSFNARSAGTGMAGLRIEFAVCTIFDRFTCTYNESGGFYSSLAPTYGIVCEARGALEGTAACLFINPVLEGMTIGIQGGYMVGCTWLGGTAEACTSTGIYLTSDDVENVFVGTFHEVNTDYDLLIQGHRNTFIGINSADLIELGDSASLNTFIGGATDQLTLGASTARNVFSGFIYNRYATGGLTDSGSGNSFATAINAATTTLGRPPSTTTPTLSGSPYTYTNSTGDIQEVIVQGGTVSALAYIRSGQSGRVVGYDSAGTALTLRPGDSAQIAYSAAPSVYVLI